MRFWRWRSVLVGKLLATDGVKPGNKAKICGLSLFLFALNLSICWRFLRFDYIDKMGSIEGAYFAISRHLMESWRDLSWWPTWYGGIPFSYSYPPVVHTLTALYAALFPVSVPHAYHIVAGCFYALGPVTLFWLAARLSESLRYGFFAGLAYSVVSPSAFLIPSVLKDLDTPLWPRRLQTLTGYGDSGHVAALALVPLAVLLFDYALSKNRPRWYVAAAAGFAAVALTNWIGAMALALFLFSYLLARNSVYPWLKALGTGVLAYLFAATYFTPALVRTIQFNSQTLGGDFRSAPQNLLNVLPYILISLVFIKALCEKLRVARHTQMFLYFTLLTGCICMSAEWFKLPLVPQPQRYHLEFELGLVLLFVIPVAQHLDSLNRRWKFACLTVVALFCLSQVRLDRKFAKTMIRPIDITGTVEYKTAIWFDRNLPGQRVMALGSQAFFMNAFTGSPQLAGGFEPANPNWENRIAQYQVATSDAGGEQSAAITLYWLKAFGIQAIAVGGPHSKTAYRNFIDVSRFEEIGTLVWREGDDSIYKIPQRNDSLAHAVLAADLVKTPPDNGIDIAEVKKYADAIDNPSYPVVAYRWTSQHSAELNANLHTSDVLATQINYFPGWKGDVAGKPIQTRADGLGLLVLEPDCSGNCVVNITYDGGAEFKAAQWLSLMGLSIGLVLCVVPNASSILRGRPHAQPVGEIATAGTPASYAGGG